MYCSIHFFNNACAPDEKMVNPVNMAIRPADIDRLTAEGKATCTSQLKDALYYPNVADGVMPFEFTRGIDENDAWEESQKASKKVHEYIKHKVQQSSMTEEHF